LRIRWLSLACLLLTVSGVQARDRLYLDASLDAETRTISGYASFDIRDKGTELTDLRLRLYPNIGCIDNDSCGVQIDSLIVNGVDVTERISADGTDLYVSFEDAVSPARSLEVTAWFTTHISTSDDRLFCVQNRYLLTGWFPMLAPWQEGQWRRVFYRDFLEPAADLLDIEASISFPNSLELMAPGVEAVDTAEDRTTARLALEASSGLPLFLAQGYQQDSTVVRGAALKIYYRETDLFCLDTVRNAAEAALNFMSNYVFLYPHDELIIVIGGLKRGGGLEQPRMILASTPPRTAFSRLYAAMITHEVVHQWFYGVVNSNQAEAPWLDEAVTEYLGLKIGHYRAGGEPDLIDVFGLTGDHLTLNRMNARSVMETDPITRPGDEFYNQSVYYRTVYSKGTSILQTIGALMGEGNEQAFWKEYAETFMYSNPQPEDFVRLANRYLPQSKGADVRTILDLTTNTDFAIVSLNAEAAEIPDSQATASEDNPGWNVSVEYLAQHPLGFPVELRIELVDGTVIDTVVNPGPGRHRIEYATTSPALAAIIDPDYKYAVDGDYLNNSLVTKRSVGAAMRLFSGVTFLVESLFSSLWGW